MPPASRPFFSDPDEAAPIVASSLSPPRLRPALSGVPPRSSRPNTTAAGVRPRAGVRPPIYVGEQLHPMTPSSSSCSTHSIADPEGDQNRAAPASPNPNKNKSGSKPRSSRPSHLPSHALSSTPNNQRPRFHAPSQQGSEAHMAASRSSSPVFRASAVQLPITSKPTCSSSQITDPDLPWTNPSKFKIAAARLLHASFLPSSIRRPPIFPAAGAPEPNPKRILDRVQGSGSRPHPSRNSVGATGGHANTSAVERVTRKYRIISALYYK